MVLRTLAAALAAVALLPASAQARSLFVNGDSLAVGTRPYLSSALPGWRVTTSASISRQDYQGPAVLRGRRLPRYIAVSLGTNGDPRNTGTFRSSIRRTMAIAGRRRCVVWATIRRPPVAGATYDRLNRVLRQEARRRRNLKVVAWARLVNRNRGWLADDGVHVSAAGYRARARAYARALRRCPG